ncbi:type II secretion system protein N [Marinobacter oulmenensis]|uniref:General secretion pathway protein C n=1 Tax=Marinobacter oulmenensis TaxID=643747 RepID=A0A840U5S9_9GAMM|nr:type II secretion system protein N [Marinobacter oulmenensis]MBB5320489.1 general secretion pathway protein C [Marinobacter oulmenensis]
MTGTDRNTPLLITLAAALAMLAGTGWQIYRFWQTEATRETPEITGVNMAGPNQGMPEPRSELSAIPLFGTPGTANASGKASNRPAPENTTGLTLRGALAAAGKSPGTALIETDDGTTKAYAEGDTLPGGGILRRVFPSRIIVEHNGTLANIYLSDSPALAETPTSQEPETATDDAGMGTDRPVAASQPRRQEIQRRLEQLQQRLRANQ